MRIPFTLPELEVEFVLASAWLADEGELVYEGDRLLEVATEGATFDVSSPVTGLLQEKLVLPRDRIIPGQVLGIVVSDQEVDAP